MNILVQGPQLSKMLSLPLLIGYVAQIVSTGTTYRSLEGPVLGTRVGIYHSLSMDAGWRLIDSNEDTPPMIPGGELSVSVEEGPPPRILGREPTPPGYRMILYRTPTGAPEEGSVLLEDGVSTVPRSVHHHIRKRQMIKSRICVIIRGVFFR